MILEVFGTILEYKFVFYTKNLACKILLNFLSIKKDPTGKNPAGPFLTSLWN
jgi:hypothetical protein